MPVGGALDYSVEIEELRVQNKALQEQAESIKVGLAGTQLKVQTIEDELAQKVFPEHKELENLAKAQEGTIKEVQT